MPTVKPITYLFDFDSTFITSEGLDELAAVSLKGHPQKNERLNQIQEFTKAGMNGEIGFEESLKKRLALLTSHKTHVQTVSQNLKKKISPSIKRNKKFFLENREHIYIISGGFKEFILPVVEKFGIHDSHILANTFVYDKKGNIVGIDEANPMSKDQGKVKTVKKLNLATDLYVIGDGYTDFEIKKQGLAKKFIAFTENVTRESVVKHADLVAPSFEEFLYANKLPSSLSYPKNRIKVLLLENVHADAIAYFEKEGYAVEHLTKSLPEEELVKKITDVTILGIRSKTKITKAVLDAGQHLLAIGIFAIGTNQVDLSYATQKGIAVFNAPYCNTRSVTEMIIGEIIMLSRRTFEKSTLLHRGLWDKAANYSHEVRGRKLGIIGYGHIGSQVSVIAEALGMEVFYYNTSEKQSFGNAKKCETMTELLKTVDIVTVHVSGKAQNKNLINAKAFKQMKDGVLFLNASRGFVVDIDALTENLKTGKVKGAAIDVFPSEPGKNGDPFTTPLAGLPNVILTPHLGSGTEEAQRTIAEYVPKKLIDFVNTGNTDLSVNMPNLQLQPQGRAHRFLHLHQNVPGILAQINSVLASHKSNILGQYLKTDAAVGYVITDVDKKYDAKVIEDLKNIEQTIKFRVLY